MGQADKVNNCGPAQVGGAPPNMLLDVQHDKHQQDGCISPLLNTRKGPKESPPTES